MKQKNLLLIAVAVGCGLVAAILTTQMGGTAPPPREVKQVSVLVATKDLPVNTKLTKEKIDELVVFKQYSEESVPQQPFVNSKEEMIGKSLTRGMRKDDFFLPADLTSKVTLELPARMHMMTLNISRDQLVGGFAVPGSRVDILATMMLPRSGRQYVFPLLRNMLILAVDTQNQSPEQKVMPTVSDVSLAVTNDDATILVGAMSRGCGLRFLLLGDKPDSKYPVASEITREQVRAVLAGEYDPYAKKDDDNNGLPVAPEAVELPVPTEDLPAGTQLTEEIIDKAFAMQKIVPPAPANVVKNIREYVGKYTQKDIAANQFVPRSFMADSAPKKPEAVAVATPEKIGKPGAADDGTAPKAAPELPAPPKGPTKLPPRFWHVTVQTATGAKKYQYQILENGSYKFIGETKVEEALTEELVKPKPESEPKSATKPAL